MSATATHFPILLICILMESGPRQQRPHM
jgi:hypothetical protein